VVESVSIILMEGRLPVMSLARRAKRGASGRVEVPAWEGLTTHHYRVLRLWRNGVAVRRDCGIREQER